jgi:hypothetical protein
LVSLQEFFYERIKMIIYEVNIDVEPTMADKYVAWLRAHIGEMRTELRGIQRVVMAARDPAEDGWACFTVTYILAAKEDLDDYIAHRAGGMRQKAVEAFGASSFRASRRIMNVLFEE